MRLCVSVFFVLLRCLFVVFVYFVVVPLCVCVVCVYMDLRLCARICVYFCDCVCASSFCFRVLSIFLKSFVFLFCALSGEGTDDHDASTFCAKKHRSTKIVKGTCCLLGHVQQTRRLSEAALERSVLEVAQGSRVTCRRPLGIGSRVCVQEVLHPCHPMERVKHTGRAARHVNTPSAENSTY